VGDRWEKLVCRQKRERLPGPRLLASSSNDVVRSKSSSHSSMGSKPGRGLSQGASILEGERESPPLSSSRAINKGRGGGGGEEGERQGGGEEQP
jgi:hypothetical protein